MTYFLKEMMKNIYTYIITMSRVKKLTKTVFTFIFLFPLFPLIAVRHCLPFPFTILSEPLLLAPLLSFSSLP